MVHQLGLNFLKFLLLPLLFFALLPLDASALDRRGRLGVGASNQLANQIPAFSFKIQRSRTFAFGGLFGIDTADDGGYGIGVKAYRLLFEEPQLNFYTAGLIGLISEKKDEDDNDTGFQFDWTFGSEFSFSGLESLGFSFEFGFSFNKLDDFKIQTKADHMIKAAVHFYL